MSTRAFPALESVEDRLRHAPHVLVGLDYDGTLTPIVDNPADALLSTSMRQAIWGLTQHEDVSVAIISGRAHAELRELVGIPAIVYAGNHGMEISGPGFEFIEPTAQAAARDLHLLGEAIAHNLADVPGVFVEDKGLTLSVHYRRVPPLYCEKVWHAVYDIVAKHRDEFHLTLGNKVYEIRPNVSWNKGAAIGWIREQVGTSDTVVIYIGDDTTDEDAFLALGEDAVTIRVCDHGHTAASFILQDPTTVQQFLHWIAELRSSDQENVLESAVEKGAVP